ncbi:MAG TPA: hypothetical protein PKD18_05825 [Saprospiraceae bacterium]|nr:hypothetical protein [Saprospiraceae bacterium]
MEKTNKNLEKMDFTTLLANKSKQDQQKEVEEEIVIPDECGDTLWDKVLAQYEKVETPKS